MPPENSLIIPDTIWYDDIIIEHFPPWNISFKD
jgi:hypothetical protein